MYDVDLLKAGLLSLVGWRQGNETGAYDISALTTSDSGMYYNDEHPVLNQAVLQSIAPDFARLTYNTYDAGTAYIAGQVVTYSSVNYICILAGTGKTPSTQPTYWEVYKPFELWLKEKTEASIVRAIQRWAEEKQINKTARSIFEHKYLFEGAGRMVDTIASTSKVVGLELDMVRGMGVNVYLDRVACQFATNGTFNLYLFHSGKSTPVQTKSIAYTGAGDIQWVDLGWTLSYDDDPGSAYYVAYHQDSAPLAINRALDWGNLSNCEDCSGRGGFNSYNLWSEYLEVHPFAATGTEGTLQDVSGNDYTYLLNYGLNLQVSVRCDLTQIILDQKDLFKGLIAKQVAIDLMREVIFNANERINVGDRQINRDLLMYELDGDPKGRPTGKMVEYERSLKATMLDFEGLDKVCLPCLKKGVRVKMM